MKKKIFSVVLTLLLVLQLTGIFSASAGTVSAEDKIDAALLELMNAADGSETIPVVIWMTDIEHETIEENATAYRHEQVSTLIAELPETEYATPAAGIAAMTNADDLTVDEEQVREVTNGYIMHKRTAHETAYTAANEEKIYSVFSLEETAKTRNAGTEQAELVYISMYSPIVLMELTAEQIYQACESELVTAVYYNAPPEETCTDLMSTAEATTGTADLRENKGLDGTGIKIGMIENGIPAPNSTYFDTTKITIDEDFLYSDGSINGFYITAHACQVASVLVGKNDGIVPNAELYCTSTKKEGAEFAGIEWLLSQGVNVINISNSLGEYSAGDGYGFASAWMDHVALQHSVHIVKAVGNIDEDYPITVIPESSYAYNIISVGAVNSNGMLESYSNFSISQCKPDICAPGTVYIQYGASTDAYYEDDIFHARVISPERATVGGTSFATPIVTAVVAQFCQKNSTLLICQDVMKSILLAGVENQGIYSTAGTDSSILRVAYGAGCLNASNSYYIVNAGRWYNSYFSASAGAGTVYTRTITVSASDDCIRIALTWLSSVRITSDAHETASTLSSSLDNLQLKVVAPDGSYWLSALSLGNVQAIAFNPQETSGAGTYTIEVIRNTSSENRVYFGLAWY